MPRGDVRIAADEAAHSCSFTCSMRVCAQASSVRSGPAADGLADPRASVLRRCTAASGGACEHTAMPSIADNRLHPRPSATAPTSSVRVVVRCLAEPTSPSEHHELRAFIDHLAHVCSGAGGVIPMEAALSSNGGMCLLFHDELAHLTRSRGTFLPASLGDCQS